MKIDFSACVVNGGGDPAARIDSAKTAYPAECAEYFAELCSKKGQSFYESASGFLLLDGLLTKNKINRASVVIKLGKNNRPRISGNPSQPLDFSVSHSEGCAVCVLAVGEGDVKIGCDVQRVRDYSEQRAEELARVFMSEAELKAFLSSSDKISDFFRAWTRREAYVKRLGLDIYDNLGEISMDGRFIESVIYSAGEKYFYCVNLPEGAVLDEEKNDENGEVS